MSFSLFTKGSNEASWVSAGAAVAIVLGGLINYAWRQRKHIKHYLWVMTRPFRLVGEIEGLNKKMNRVLEQVEKNGGKSMKDTIDRIEEWAKSSDEAATARMQMVTELSAQIANQNALLISVMNSDKRPMFQFNASGNGVWCNRAFLELTGRQRSDVLGMGWINTVHPDDRQTIRGLWNSAVAEKRSFEEEYRILDMAGETHRVVAYVYPTSDKGVVTGWIGHLEYLWSGREDSEEDVREATTERRARKRTRTRRPRDDTTTE